VVVDFCRILRIPGRPHQKKAIPGSKEFVQFLIQEFDHSLPLDYFRSVSVSTDRV
jgi:hypothetical protein